MAKSPDLSRIEAAGQSNDHGEGKMPQLVTKNSNEQILDILTNHEAIRNHNTLFSPQTATLDNDSQ